jgi:NADPH-dependent curcumin reductase CurA
MLSALKLSSRSLPQLGRRSFASYNNIIMTASIPKTMRALQIQQQGGLEVLDIKEIPVPQPGKGQVLIKTEWSGVSSFACNPAPEIRSGAES